MNKKGQVLFIMYFMVATFVILLVLGFIVPFSDTIALQRTNLDCTNTSISTGTQITCLGLDLTLPFWIGMIALAGFGVLWKKNRGEL